jgi:hypothetical protein
MKRLSIILIAVGGLMYCPIGKAGIIYLHYADDGDGAITCSPYTWNGSPSDLSVAISGNECFGGAAQILGTITTDTATDPTLTLSSAINNDTGFAWTAYQVNVYMSSPFTLSAASVTLPNDWTAAVTAPFSVSSPYGSYEGQLMFTGGTPVAINGELDFSYKISFSGATSYNFTQEMIPVPEPGAFGFLAAGSLLLGGFLTARRRNRHS